MEVKEVPQNVLGVIAEQIEVSASAFASYGERENTLYEHLDELRRECGFRTCGFQPFRESEPSLQALEHVSTLAKHRRRVTAKEQKVGKVKMHAPLGHLTARRRKYGLEGEKITSNYEAAAFDALKGRVRSGDIAVAGSRRYRPFEHYLLPAPDFECIAEKQQTRLAINSDAEAYVTAKQQEITQRLAALQESIGKVEGSLILDEKGHLHLPQLEKAVPEDVERLKKRVYALLPHVPLADLQLEVDTWTGFLRHFTHLTSKDAPVGSQKLELVAALMGMGMNLGLEKMAESCPLPIASSPGLCPGNGQRDERWNKQAPMSGSPDPPARDLLVQASNVFRWPSTLRRP